MNTNPKPSPQPINLVQRGMIAFILALIPITYVVLYIILGFSTINNSDRFWVPAYFVPAGIALILGIIDLSRNGRKVFALIGTGLAILEICAPFCLFLYVHGVIGV